MKLNIYQIDAFAEQVFTGNPAAVIPLETWLPDNLMQNIAQENNLSETAFLVPTEKGFHIRWFTPAAEVDLCGHATLATAHVLFNHLNYSENKIHFESETRGIIATAKSENYDFVSRFFAPAVGINEDPVTGSAHTMLIPYWAKQFGKNELIAKQISVRGGILHCKNLGDRVEIGGKAVTYLVGEINF